MSENRVHGQYYLSVDIDWCMHTQYSVRSTSCEIDSRVAPCRPAFWNRGKNVQAIIAPTLFNISKFYNFCRKDISSPVAVLVQFLCSDWFSFWNFDLSRVILADQNEIRGFPTMNYCKILWKNSMSGGMQFQKRRQYFYGCL